MSNAERQKRYRDSKRNAPVTETVTRVTVEPERNAQPLQPNSDIENRTRPPTPSGTVFDLSDIDLQLRLKSYQGVSWVNSPEHKEVLRRRGSNEQALQAAGACL